MRIYSLVLILLCSGCVREPAPSRASRASYSPSKPYLIRATWAEYGYEDQDDLFGRFYRTGHAELWGKKHNNKITTEAWIGHEIGTHNWPASIYAIRYDGKKFHDKIPLYPMPMPSGEYGDVTVFERWHK